ncbi:MAG: hypothetical protein NTW94_04700 [Legionellales bacterium]|nr:hypothetical protein [Legionellales bacterium]
MLDLSSLSTQHLVQILELRSTNERLQGLDIETLINAQRLPPQFVRNIKKQQPIARSAQSAFEIIGAMIDTWWAVVSVANLALFFTIAAAAIAGALGLIYAFYTYRGRLQSSQDLENAYRLALLQSTASELIFKRHHKDLKSDMNRQRNPLKTPPFVPSKLKLIATISFTSTLFFFSYFYGVSSILECIGFLGLAAAMSNPISVLLAGIFGLGLGFYFAYMYYQDKKNMHLMKTECAHLTTRVSEERQFIHALSLLNPMRNKNLHQTTTKLEEQRLPHKSISARFFIPRSQQSPTHNPEHHSRLVFG